MQTHDEEPASRARSKIAAPHAGDQTTALVGQALAAGRPDRLSRGGALFLQRAAGNASVGGLMGALEGEAERSPVRDVVGRGGGEPLDDATREFMEARLGADFSDVRVHTGSSAAESAKSVSAQAYTVGSDIVFQEGRFDPTTHPGRRMLAHELTHVVQQRVGEVDGTPAAGGIRISNPSDRFERAAEASADRVMSGAPVPASPEPAASAAVQRQDEEEERVQTLPVQREEGEEEEAQA